METDADYAKLELLCESEELVGGVHGSSELQTQAAQARRVIGGDAQKELSSWIELLDLVELIGVVECHLLNALVGRVAHIRVGLAWLSINDAAWVDAHLQDLFNLCLRGTIEASSKLRQKANDLGVGVTFDRFKVLA